MSVDLETVEAAISQLKESGKKASWVMVNRKEFNSLFPEWKSKQMVKRLKREKGISYKLIRLQ